MAEGRMISRRIGCDLRIAKLSQKARLLWFAIIPIQEHNGLIPRNAVELRLGAIPAWLDITNEDMEAAIREWFATDPPIIKETIYKKEIWLKTTDYERCNWNSSANKMERNRTKKSNNVTDVTNIGNCDQYWLEGKGKERKGRERNKQHICSFERFWEAYPRKEGRKPALQRWLQRRPEEELVNLILKAVVKQKGSAQWRQGIIPHAATWLNQERWTDEQETNNNDPIYA